LYVEKLKEFGLSNLKVWPIGKTFSKKIMLTPHLTFKLSLGTCVENIPKEYLLRADFGEEHINILPLPCIFHIYKNNF